MQSFYYSCIGINSPAPFLFLKIQICLSVTMLRITVFLVLVPWSNVLSETVSVGEIKVLEDNCQVMERAFANTVHSDDRCLFVIMDQVECPLVAPNVTLFTVSLDQMFSGLIHQHQKIVFCDKVVAFFKDFNTFRYFIRNKDLKTVFQPYTRIIVFTLTNEGFNGILDKETHQKAILNNGLFMNFARILNATHYQIEDVLTKEILTYSENKELALYVKARKNYQDHPLFLMKDKVFNVSLFHCPPHVIKLDDRMTMDR